jgi:hypothetical protein
MLKHMSTGCKIIIIATCLIVTCMLWMFFVTDAP